MDTASGTGLGDPGPEDSLGADPTVVRLRAAVQPLGDDIWIAGNLPGGDDDRDDDVQPLR
jgi:hypothetical protein